MALGVSLTNSSKKALVLSISSLSLIPIIGDLVNFEIEKQSIISPFSITQVGLYQATNFIYTGLSAKRTDWKIKGLEHLHGATIADMSRGQPDRAGYMRKKHGDDFYLEDRPRKHRYVYIHAGSKDRKRLISSLNYGIEAYPKGESKRYDAGGDVSTQPQLFM